MISAFTEHAAEITRATGLVSGVVLVVTLVSGFLFSARETGTKRKPAWWLDFHNGLGGVATVALVVHIVAAVYDRDQSIGVARVFIPFIATTYRWPVTWGVIAMYLFAGTVFSTWPWRLRNRRRWRIIHLSSTVGVALALLHGEQMGTDAGRLLFEVGLVMLVAPAVYGLSVRGFDAIRFRS
jgi:hypothetical protein